MNQKKINILLVCMGNICRSPTAHGVLQQRINDAELGESVYIDSAGTYGAHAGELPDSRSMEVASIRGYDLSFIRSRKVETSDFETFDYILAMDQTNFNDLKHKAPAYAEHKIELFLDYGSTHTREVPDPYYGDGDGFNNVLDLIEDACDGLVAHIKNLTEEPISA